MNSDTIKGNWQQLTGHVKQQWAKLTDDDLLYIDGVRDRFVGRLQERYGKARDAIEAEVKDWNTHHHLWAETEPAPAAKADAKHGKQHPSSELHQRAAEAHETAAKHHREAAAAHADEQDLDAKRHSALAIENGDKAYKRTHQAHQQTSGGKKH